LIVSGLREKHNTFTNVSGIKRTSIQAANKVAADMKESTSSDMRDLWLGPWLARHAFWFL